MDRTHSAKWLKATYPKTPDSLKPFECTQQPGDFVLFPESWHHAVVNSGLTAAVTFEALREKMWELADMNKIQKQEL